MVALLPSEWEVLRACRILRGKCHREYVSSVPKATSRDGERRSARAHICGTAAEAAAEQDHSGGDGHPERGRGAGGGCDGDIKAAGGGHGGDKPAAQLRVCCRRNGPRTSPIGLKCLVDRFFSDSEFMRKCQFYWRKYLKFQKVLWSYKVFFKHPHCR
jgi:hypothetical protein